MSIGELDRRTVWLLALGVVAVLALRFGVYGDRPARVIAANDTIPLAEKRLARLRQIAAMAPGKEIVLKQVQAELAEREKGVIATETAAQAQAQLLEILRRIGKSENIDLRGAEDLRVKPLAGDYGEVSVAVTFTCRIEQLVNFLAALANEPELLATNEIRIGAGNPKDKTITVRLGLSGVVPRRLVPEKKGVAAF